MRSIHDLLDAAKARHGITSDYKLAMFLGIGEANIRSYRKGRSLPDASMCARIADALGEDPLYLIAEIESQRAANDDAAHLWRRMAERLKGAAVVAFAVVIAYGLTAAYTPSSALADVAGSVRYVQWLTAAMLARLILRVWSLTRAGGQFHSAGA